jgi:hypothetical protein
MTSTDSDSASSNEAVEIDFRTFVLSLTSSAMYHLGEIPDPDTGDAQVNLPLAQQTIEIIAMLQEKTRGNLNDEEQKTIDALLAELRVRFVEASK